MTGFATGWSGTDIVEMPDGNVGYLAFGTGADGTGALKKLRGKETRHERREHGTRERRPALVAEGFSRAT